MRGVRFVVVVLAMSLCAAVAQGGDPTKPPEAATYEAVAVLPAELPAGVKPLTAVRAASRAAQGFWMDPGYAGTLDAPPLRKSFQSFQAERGVAGSVFLFEYDGAVPSFIQRVAETSLRGPEGAKTPADEIIVHRNLMWIVSFPEGDPAAEWFKERLRTRFGIPALRAHASAATVLPDFWNSAVGGGDFAAAILSADAALKNDPDWAEVHYLKAELCQQSGRGAEAEAAYRRAFELHERCVDPLPENLAWAALDGIGLSLLLQKRYGDAAAVLTQALERGKARRLELDETPQTAYALAVALANVSRWNESLKALTEAVCRDQTIIGVAQHDPGMDPARKRPEFRALLELDPPKRTAIPPAPKALPGAGDTITIDAVALRANELPSGWRLVKGSQCISTSIHRYHRTPDMWALAPRDPRLDEARKKMPRQPMPVRKSLESLVLPDGSAGSVVQFEYETDVDDITVKSLEGLLWGTEGRSHRSPELLIAHGRFLWVLSFPLGHPATDWWQDRLRRRFRVPITRVTPMLRAPVLRLGSCASGGRVAEGIRIFDTYASVFADCATAWFFRGELAVGGSDYAGAEAAYGRAVAIHDSFSDSLGANELWACLDGHGTAILMQKRPKEALPILERARVCPGRSAGADGSGTDYNIACTYALLGRFDEALAALTEAIKSKPAWKESAREDGDFAEARKRPDFQKLLAK